MSFITVDKVSVVLLFALLAGLPGRPALAADEDVSKRVFGSGDAHDDGGAAPGGPGTVTDLGTRESGILLSQALDAVWADHPRVAQAERALDASRIDVSASRAGYYPSVAVQAEQRDDGQNTSIVRFIQPLWDGGLTAAQVDQARSAQLIALAELAQIQLDLATSTSEAYLALAASSELALQWQRYIDDLENLLDLIRRRSSQGVAPLSEVQTAQARLSQAYAGASANEAQLLAARAQLQSLINRTPSSLAWPGDHHLLSASERRLAGSLNIEAHPSRQLSTANVRQLRAQSKASRAGLWPRLAVEYRRQLDGFVVDPNNDDAALLVMEYQTDSGLRGYRNHQADQQRVLSAEASTAAVIREVDAQIAVAKAELAAAENQLDAQQDSAAASYLLVESFQRQFEAGRKSWLEVLNAHREANDASLQATNIRRQLWSANNRLALQGLFWRRLSERAPSVQVIEER